jgi:DnaJ-class molecular chaperone
MFNFDPKDTEIVLKRRCKRCKGTGEVDPSNCDYECDDGDVGDIYMPPQTRCHECDGAGYVETSISIADFIDAIINKVE